LQPRFEIPVLSVRQSGLGAGTRDLDQPNALRISLCDAAETGSREAVQLLETNLDNVSAEDLGADLIQDLLDQGALDAWLTPILMKKGRPAQQLQLLCRPETGPALSEYLLQRVPTLGVRSFDGQRFTLDREIRVLSLPQGVVEVKVHKLPNGQERYFPEYESCRILAETCGTPLAEIRESARRAAELSR
ncbi:MAG: nickel insertion protein, partial [Kiritimatiellia bacterium]